MKIIVEEKKEKPLVERTEFEVRIKEFASTPSNAQIQEEVSKLANRPKELVVVKHIYQHFGKNEAKALVYAYNSPESLAKFEPKKKGNKEATAPAPAAQA